MSNNRRTRTSFTVEVNLRTVSFAAAGVLFVVGSLALLALVAVACVAPNTELDLRVWLTGVLGVTAVLAALTVCGYAALAKLLTARLDAHAARSRKDMNEMREHFAQEVAGFTAGVNHVVGVLRDALPEQDEPPAPQFGPDSNVVPFPTPADRDYASAN